MKKAILILAMMPMWCKAQNVIEYAHKPFVKYKNDTSNGVIKWIQLVSFEPMEFIGQGFVVDSFWDEYPKYEGGILLGNIEDYKWHRAKRITVFVSKTIPINVEFSSPIFLNPDKAYEFIQDSQFQ